MLVAKPVLSIAKSDSTALSGLALASIRDFNSGVKAASAR